MAFLTAGMMVSKAHKVKDSYRGNVSMCCPSFVFQQIFNFIEHIIGNSSVCTQVAFLIE